MTAPLEPLDPSSLPEPVDVSDDRAALAAVAAVVAAGPFDATWESLASHRVPRWYREARFGIFLHWGAYAVPAFDNEWYPRTMYRQGSRAFEHHRATYGPQDRFGYKDLIPHFRMERFDPSAWAALFRRAGAQFVVPVAEHHDGYTLYDTARSRWKAPLIGPQRDVFGDLLAAVDAQWMVRGASTHRAEHWFFMNGGTMFESDVRDPAWADLYGPASRTEISPTERFLEDWLLRTVEIIDRYRPQILYFDTGIEEPSFEPYLRRAAAYYYNRAAQWGREVVINAKWSAFAPGAAVPDIERGTLGGIQPEVWQVDTSVARTSWSWVEGQEYKEAGEVLAELADVVSKNGNLLLNVGPRADGTIAEDEIRVLERVGDWLARNGEAVYGTAPWVTFGEGPTRAASGAFTEGRSGCTAADLRFTTRTAVGHYYVYAIALAAPSDGRLRVRSFAPGAGLLGRPITDVRVLGWTDPVEWRLTDDHLEVTIPSGLRGLDGGPVVRVELAADPPAERTDFLYGMWV